MSALSFVHSWVTTVVIAFSFTINNLFDIPFSPPSLSFFFLAWTARIELEICAGISFFLFYFLFVLLPLPNKRTNQRGGNDFWEMESGWQRGREGETSKERKKEGPLKKEVMPPPSSHSPSSPYALPPQSGNRTKINEGTQDRKTTPEETLAWVGLPVKGQGTDTYEYSHSSVALSVPREAYSTTLPKNEKKIPMLHCSLHTHKKKDGSLSSPSPIKEPRGFENQQQQIKKKKRLGTFRCFLFAPVHDWFLRWLHFALRAPNESQLCGHA